MNIIGSCDQKMLLIEYFKYYILYISILVFKRKENYTPRSQTPAEAKAAYTQIQKGGDIPVSGLRMSFPDKAKGK